LINSLYINNGAEAKLKGDMTNIICSGAILAGGQNKRFNGANKAFLNINGRKMLDKIYSIFKVVFNETILVTNNPEEYLNRDLTIVSDIFSVRSSLTGIHAALFYANNPFVFISACDTPFLKKELVELIVKQTEPNIDAVIPETKAGLEPLCAVYSRKCLKCIEQNILQDKLKIQGILSKIRIKTIPEEILREADKNLISFFNINSPADLESAKKLFTDN
jgi:molybdopterin-guanine dinucleotide biosynthesis protein A